MKQRETRFQEPLVDSRKSVSPHAKLFLTEPCLFLHKEISTPSFRVKRFKPCKVCSSEHCELDLFFPCRPACIVRISISVILLFFFLIPLPSSPGVLQWDIAAFLPLLHALIASGPQGHQITALLPINCVPTAYCNARIMSRVNKAVVICNAK